jgi:phosphoribosyl-AMP cyclohydrolase
MMEEIVNVKKLDFRKGGGLIPVITQDYRSKKVLMLAYTNVRALEETLRTGYAHYWSRTRRRLWRKGETSGNVQRIRRVLVDCDGDALLFVVEQKGNACHTGRWTCFHKRLMEEHSSA